MTRQRAPDWPGSCFTNRLAPRHESGCSEIESMHRYSLRFIGLFLITTTAVLAQQRQQIKIFIVPNPTGWPTIMAAEIPSGMKVDSKASYTWEFPSDTSGKCVANGRQDAKPCQGRAVDYSFTKSGKQTIKLTIRDAGNGIQNPLTIQQEFTVPELKDIPEAKRAEIRQLDDNTTKAWINALYRLKDLAIYDHLAKIHYESFSAGADSKGGLRSAAHSSPSFLPWHRMSMRVVERCLSVAIGDDSFGIPYWDWQKGWQGLDKVFGPQGDPKNSYIVPSGPFCNDPKQPKSDRCPQRWIFPSDFQGEVKALARELGADPGFHFLKKEELDALLNIQTYDQAPFNDQPTKDSFRNALEGWLSPQDESKGFNHNGVHRWLGGTMGDVVVSFHDPVFIIHHAQVDRIFTMWQDKYKCTDGRQSDTCYRPGTTDGQVNANLGGAKEVTKDGKKVWSIEGHMYGDTLFPWPVSNRDALKARQGYKYLDTNEKMTPPKSSNNTSPPPSYSRSGADQTLSDFILVGASVIVSLMASLLL